MNFNWFVVFHQQKPNHRTYLAGFSIAALILKIHCEQSRSSTNRTLPQLDAYWVRGRSDTKMAALAPPIASPRQNVSYFLDSPRILRSGPVVWTQTVGFGSFMTLKYTGDTLL